MDLISRVAEGLAALALLGVLGIMVVEIAYRTFWGRSTLIADEYSSYGLVILSFLGLAGALRSGQHVRLTILLQWLGRRFGPRPEALLQLVSCLALLVFTAVLGYHLAELAQNSYENGTVSVTIARTPLWIVQGFTVLGFAVLALETVRQTVLAASDFLRNEHPNTNVEEVL
ncbi:TRAP transporter small permease subunit [Nocardioides houyundeii]|uniref:TRAP transporter small permease subunit n=1 Tax=Nocardioides houyundeii TaxID=2045452 RepID=UPI0013B3EDBE|nr:TRAP transporter small permease [Nocardioides houyundeii]